jgi:hypothetical protein
MEIPRRRTLVRGTAQYQRNRWKSHASGETERHPLHNSRERVIQVVGGCGGDASGGRQRKESGQVKEEQSLDFGMSATVI